MILLGLKQEMEDHVSSVLHRQNRSSTIRGHNPPEYTKAELIDWLYSNGFEEMYRDYVQSGYDSEKQPSIHRIDNSRGYSLDNVQLLTWAEHRGMPRGVYKKFNPKKTRKKIEDHQYGDRVLNCREYFDTREIKTYMPLLFWASDKIRKETALQKKVRRLMSGRITSKDIDAINELEIAVDRLRVAGYAIEIN